jgi:hypothetical protein
MRTSLLFLFLCTAASGDPVCRSVDVTFQPVANLQMAVWVEDASGNYVDTAYVTRLTGALGLANRPGHHFFKSDYRFPYGRRDMVLPVWAHKRNHPYGYVVMGGQSGNSMAKCMAGGIQASECDDMTIGYHFSVSSPEPFYCSPRGGVHQMVSGMDVISCASPFYGCKGAYADAPMVSLYPPRADLTSFVDGHDGPDARAYSNINDLVAVSGATPQGNAVIEPIHWNPPADGNYVLKVEASLEKDFNASNNHPAQPDEHAELDGYGQNFLGQGSVVYSVPFTVGDTRFIGTAASYAGYGDWDGASGTLHAPDATINDTPGSGAGRLLNTSDDQGTWRVKVVADPSCMVMPTTDGGMPAMDGGTAMDGGMQTCTAPGAPTGLILGAHASSFDVTFASAPSGTPTTRFDIRYSYSAISDADFLRAIPSSTAAPNPGIPGTTVSTLLTGLKPEQQYFVAVRALSSCGAASPIVTGQALTSKAQFVTLNGCFIATAAYGTPLAAQIGVLRRFRDRTLLPSPIGQLAVAAYYSLSPPIAAAITSDERLRAGARALVEPVVRLTRALH